MLRHRDLAEARRDAVTRAGTDHAALMHRAARDTRNYTREDCARIMLAGAERLRQLESDVRAERARVERITAGYARLMEQAAEVVGEAVRITGNR